MHVQHWLTQLLTQAKLIKSNVVVVGNKRELPQAQTSKSSMGINMIIIYRKKTYKYDNQTIQNLRAFTSKGVRGHFPFILIEPGRIIRPGLVNFPLQPLSLAAFMASFSSSPPSNTQQEKATISCMREKLIRYPPTSYKAHRKSSFKLNNGSFLLSFHAKKSFYSYTSSKRRCTATYFPFLFTLRSLIRATKLSASSVIGFENLNAS